MDYDVNDDKKKFLSDLDVSIFSSSYEDNDDDHDNVTTITTPTMTMTTRSKMLKDISGKG